MGKARRARTKFHITSVQGDFNVSPSDSKFSQNDDAEISSNIKTVEVDNKSNEIHSEPNSAMETNTVGEWKVVPEDDLFKNLDINVDKLETSVQDVSESRPANISITKCIKRSVAGSGMNVKLKKGDKRELRRNLFIKKIDAIHQEVMKKKPKKAQSKSAEVNGNEQTYKIVSQKRFEETTECPEVRMLQKQSSNTKQLSTAKVSRKKQKATCKLKNKAQEMLKNIDLYNQIISDANYKTDVMGVITNAVQKKVFADL